MATCNQCGDCCDPIYLESKYSAEWVAERAARGLYDQVFITAHWHEIPAEEAYQRRPSFRTGPADVRFLECDQFDRQTRTCLARETRPEVCRGFPWYGHPFDAVFLIPFERCSYRTDTMPLVVLP